MGTRTWSKLPTLCLHVPGFCTEIMAPTLPLGSTPLGPRAAALEPLTQSQGPYGVSDRNHSFRTRKSREGQGRCVHAQSTCAHSRTRHALAPRSCPPLSHTISSPPHVCPEPTCPPPCPHKESWASGWLECLHRCLKEDKPTSNRDSDKHCFPVVKPLHFLPLLPRARGPQRRTLQMQENGLVSSCSPSLCCVTMAEGSALSRG